MGFLKSLIGMIVSAIASVLKVTEKSGTPGDENPEDRAAIERLLDDGGLVLPDD